MKFWIFLYIPPFNVGGAALHNATAATTVEHAKKGYIEQVLTCHDVSIHGSNVTQGEQLTFRTSANRGSKPMRIHLDQGE